MNVLFGSDPTVSLPVKRPSTFGRVRHRGRSDQGKGSSARPRGSARRVIVVIVAAVGLYAASATAASAYPFTTRSYYEHSGNYNTLYNQGCSAGQDGAHGVAILDFGRPAFNGTYYGAIDFDGHFNTNGVIRQAAEGYASGFWDCTPLNGPFMTIAIGTNNYCFGCSSYHVSDPSTAGSRWGDNVDTLRSYINAPPSFASQESAAGADDAEPAWNPAYTQTRDFVNGYNASTGNALFDYGSAETGYWTLGQSYHIAYGAVDDFPFPEIYYSGQAPEWEDISLWGASYGNFGAMYFEGVTSQWRSGYSCGFTPHEGYDHMLAQLQSHASTSQASIPYLTDIPCFTA
jgi:hypothetical protein